MAKIWRSIAVQIFLLGLILSPAGSMAADFELFWDPNCDADTALQGYYIYYLENASVAGNLSEATRIYLSVSNDGFDRTEPSHQISDLSNDVLYCFAVSAWYGDEESGISNEVCGINGTYAPDPDTNLDPVADAGGPYAATDSDDSGSETVTLDGSASSDSDGTISNYQWYENGTLIGTGVNPTLSFAVGSHAVTLTVTDDDNATDSNNTTVIVNSAPGENPGPDPEPDDEAPMLIIDDGDDGSLPIGPWVVSSGADPYGTQSLYTKKVGATYGFEASLSGRHEVALWWTYFENRCSEVLVEIHDGDVMLNTVLVNQTQNGGQWNNIGTYTFSGSAMVVVIPINGSCSTCADAASFRPIAPETEPDPDSDPDPEPDPPPGINPNPGHGLGPGTSNVTGDGSSGGCFISNLK